jgi:uncharacterized protein (TIGR02452 family)
LEINDKGQYRLTEDSEFDTIKKIKAILTIALDNKHDSIVLTAFGCGAFRNPPEHMVELFGNLINNEFKNQFKEIRFAIFDDHNSGTIYNPNGNFKPFFDYFSNI